MVVFTFPAPCWREIEKKASCILAREENLVMNQANRTAASCFMLKHRPRSPWWLPAELELDLSKEGPWAEGVTWMESFLLTMSEVWVRQMGVRKNLPRVPPAPSLQATLKNSISKGRPGTVLSYNELFCLGILSARGQWLHSGGIGRKAEMWRISYQTCCCPQWEPL